MKMPGLILVALAVLLSITTASAQDVVQPPAKEQAETPAQKIKNLQKERIAVLKDLVDDLARLVQSARAEFGELIEARLLLFEAQLNVAEKGEDRIALYTKTIDSLKQYEEWAIARKQSGRAPQTIVLKIKARRLEVEIQLEQMKAKELKGGK